jgi:ABC-type multidrug transport system fused ATPase/permease subunit
VAFALTLVSGAWWISSPAASTLPALALLASLALFALLVFLHNRVRRVERRAVALRMLNERGVARVRRDWNALPPPRELLPDEHPFAADLDVLGTHASLYRLLDVVSAAPGRRMLTSWLLDEPPDAATLRDRQRAVAELAPRVELREELALLARRTELVTEEDFGRFLDWAEGTGWLLGKPAVLWASRLIPVLTVAASVAAAAHVLPWSVAALSLLAGVLLVVQYRQPLRRTLATVLSRATGLREHAAMLDLVAATELESPMLRALRERSAHGGGARGALERLDSALSMAESEASLIGGVARVLLLWDFLVVARLEHWQASAGREVRRWLDALGEIEALAALATLRHDNPAWTFPDLDERADRVAGVAVGHPLLPASTRVANDVTVGPPGTLLLVTGSNMSGKSTLLRAIGLNVVLARAGGPVCAERLTMPPVELRTSIRLSDSLERGVSLFMAELARLKQIVDAAHRAPRERLLLYLLDEMLHGTNTAERQIAARAVLSHLVESGAIGAATTHDLSLAAAEPLASSSVPVHFSEHVREGEDGRPVMTFDYTLRPGLATSTNALRLLEMVGL